MIRIDYIPPKDIDALNKGKTVAQYATANATRLKIQPPDDDFTDAIGEFETAIAKVAQPNHGKVDVLEKKTARKRFEKEFRAYVQGFLAKNKYVTDVDKQNMGLPIYDTLPTTVPDPEGQAEADVEYRGRGQFSLHVRHVETTPFNPKSAHGYRIYSGKMALGDVPPASVTDLHDSLFSRRKIVKYSFAPEDSGKTVFFAIRYENSKGKMGPWGPMFSVIIP
jgi:hypothetical protein